MRGDQCGPGLPPSTMLLDLQRAKARLGQAVSELEVVFARLLAGNLGIERFPHVSPCVVAEFG